MNKVTIILIALLFQGCVSHTAVKQGSNSINGVQIETTGEWSQKKDGKRVLWTRDGYALNEISVSLLKEKDSILPGISKKENGFKVNANQTVGELMEMTLDAISVTGGLNAKLSAPKVFSINGNDAAKFSVTYDTSYGLTYQTLNLIVKSNHGIHVVRCIAPNEHYYQALEDEFNQIIDSVTVL